MQRVPPTLPRHRRRHLPPPRIWMVMVHDKMGPRRRLIMARRTSTWSQTIIKQRVAVQKRPRLSSRYANLPLKLRRFVDWSLVCDLLRGCSIYGDGSGLKFHGVRRLKCEHFHLTFHHVSPRPTKSLTELGNKNPSPKIYTLCYASNALFLPVALLRFFAWAAAFPNAACLGEEFCISSLFELTPGVNIFNHFRIA
jgi:hypothetical protein